LHGQPFSYYGKSEYNHRQVEAEKLYHERVAVILGNIEAEVSVFPFLFLQRYALHLGNFFLLYNLQFVQIVSEKQRKEAAPPVATLAVNPPAHIPEKTKYFLAEVTICFNNSCLSCYNLITERFIYYTI